MKIDLSKLLKGLESLPHTPAPEPENVPPYVLTHILEPLKTNHAVSFMELDFESFTEEDLENLYRALAETEDKEQRLNHLCSTFVILNRKPLRSGRFVKEAQLWTMNLYAVHFKQSERLVCSTNTES